MNPPAGWLAQWDGFSLSFEDLEAKAKHRLSDAHRQAITVQAQRFLNYARANPTPKRDRSMKSSKRLYRRVLTALDRPTTARTDFLRKVIHPSVFNESRLSVDAEDTVRWAAEGALGTHGKPVRKSSRAFRICAAGLYETYVQACKASGTTPKRFGHWDKWDPHTETYSERFTGEAVDFIESVFTDLLNSLPGPDRQACQSNLPADIRRAICESISAV